MRGPHTAYTQDHYTVLGQFMNGSLNIGLHVKCIYALDITFKLNLLLSNFHGVLEYSSNNQFLNLQFRMNFLSKLQLSTGVSKVDGKYVI